jgi:hypothetical protein
MMVLYVYSSQLKESDLKMSVKTMTLNLTDQEMSVVEELASKKGLNKTALMKQCLRVYQTIETRLDRGEKLFFEDEKKEKSEIVLL